MCVVDFVGELVCGRTKAQILLCWWHWLLRSISANWQQVWWLWSLCHSYWSLLSQVRVYYCPRYVCTTFPGTPSCCIVLHLRPCTSSCCIAPVELSHWNWVWLLGTLYSLKIARLFLLVVWLYGSKWCVCQGFYDEPARWPCGGCCGAQRRTLQIVGGRSLGLSHEVTCSLIAALLQWFILWLKNTCGRQHFAHFLCCVLLQSRIITCSSLSL